MISSPYASRAAPTLTIIGAGPAGLMAAEVAAEAGATVTVYDRMPSVGRKFLLAGRGGLNLTHSEPLEAFVPRYGSAAAVLRPALDAFGPDALRAWSAALGQATFIGSSGRVFPASFKTSPLLRAWLRRLDQRGVTFKPRHRWTGWTTDGGLLFEGPDGAAVVAHADATLLALGGATWPQLGSDGAWVEPLRQAGVDVAPLRPANCGMTVDWSVMFRERFEGHPLKNVALTGAGQTVRGDAMVTRAGLEGGAVYALSAPLRDAIQAQGGTTLLVALRPDIDTPTLARRLGDRPSKQSFSTYLRKSLKLSPAAIGLVQEAHHVAAATGHTEPLADMSPERLAALVKAVPVRLTGTAPMARAISSAGGIRFDAIGPDYMLRMHPGVFAAGEMLDWEAPTGGYLLQANFATGAAAARGALAWLAAGGSRAP
ncbi:TIGR03862 family flavoprotein [Lichenihabitans sp. PAMC28606]|uniref:NAD(P)/FAD-dependent oxidoreductase n=1 Tax=Lichenihabitans sp. PAMC28606 TaxID=2880932 RepID=UPI001D0B3E78|nr:TIGR03862 family flavoprotein [Lichenihabitans sp. PAMC28606]UDL94530.1 TIGR03862 family flavoprotein [Lichenihabitans sp. PAMC28606]